MRSKKGSGGARRVDGSGQLALESMSNVGVAAPSAVTGGAVVFCDPAPDRIAVGSLVLAQFMEMHSLGWVVDMRKLLRGLDWQAYVSRYKPGGRHPYHPAAMVGLLLLGHMTGRTSLRQMEAMARTDLRAWWLTGGVMPDFTSLCRFVQRHQDDLTEATFEALTAKILKLLGSLAASVSIDGTVVQAAASRWHLLKQEAAAAAATQTRQAADAAPNDKALANKAQMAQAAHETVLERDQRRTARGREPEAKVAPCEPEAVYQPLKHGGYAPSYKPSAAANADRIITGKDVHPCNEVTQVDHLLAQTERVAGAPVTTALFDAGYNAAEVLDIGECRGIELLIPEGKSTGSDESWVQARTKLGKDKFSYGAETNSYTCPQGRRLVFDHRCKSSGGKPAYVRYKSQDCRDCPLAERCLSKGARQRTLKRYAHDGRKDALRLKMQQPEIRQRYKKRQAHIEPVHSEQKRVQGMTRFRRRGLRRVKLEYSLHCMAHNLRRFGVLGSRRPTASRGRGACQRRRRAPASGLLGARRRTQRCHPRLASGWRHPARR